MIKGGIYVAGDVLKVELSINADGVVKALNEVNKSLEALNEKLNVLKSQTANFTTCTVQSDVDVDAVIEKINEELEKVISSSARARCCS